MNVVEIRRRQLPILTRRLPGTLVWQPALVVATVGTVFIAGTANAPDPTSRLKIVGVAMAAAIAYTVDDAASTTLGASPVTLLERRGLRLIVVTAIAAAWWFTLAGGLTMWLGAPLRLLSSPSTELAAYTVFGLAVAAGNSRRSEGSAAGTAGAMVVLASFASTLVRTPAWWPFRPGDGNARSQLVLIAALVALIAQSLDPLAVVGRQRR